MNTFKNKVAAITGAGSGIGQQLAISLAESGCHLAISDIDTHALETTKKLLAKYEVSVSTYELDVADQTAMRDWAEYAVKQHGSINLVFNNAGVALSGTVDGTSYEDYEWIMKINFWGVLYGTKEFLPYIKESKDGYVVNISSLFGLTAQPIFGAYNASKFAVRGLTESLIQELALLDCGVGALAVHPGGISTNIANSSRISESASSLGFNKDSTKKYTDILLRTHPKEAADVILNAILHKKCRVLIGKDAIIIDKIQRVLPVGYQKLTTMATKIMSKNHEQKNTYK